MRRWHYAVVGSAAMLLLSSELHSQWLPQPASGSGPIHYNGGNVGVGTSQPGAVSPPGFLFNANSRVLEIKTTTQNDYAALFLRRQDDAVGLDITADGHTAGIVYLDSRYATAAYGGFQFRTQTHVAPVSALRILGNGFVGIGTSNPSEQLEISSTLPTNHLMLKLNAGTDKYGQLTYYENGALRWNVYNDYATDNLTFGNTAGPKFSFTPTGRLGIGTASPTATLDVNGNINVSGSINAKYQDIAEWVPSTERLQPGTVVVLDRTRRNHVRPSATAYDTSVAGVVSAQPGLSLGEAGEEKELIATTGRVMVRVTATRPIGVGDLLVTSEVAGTAMPSEPLDVNGIAMHRPGTVLGKALETLESGSGEILVLLSLQ